MGKTIPINLKPRRRGPEIVWTLDDEALQVRTIAGEGPANGELETIPLRSIERIILRNPPSLGDQYRASAEIYHDGGAMIEIPSTGRHEDGSHNNASSDYTRLIEALVPSAALANPGMTVRAVSSPRKYVYLLISTFVILFFLALIILPEDTTFRWGRDGVWVLLTFFLVQWGACIQLGIRLPRTVDPAEPLPKQYLPAEEKGKRSSSHPRP